VCEGIFPRRPYYFHFSLRSGDPPCIREAQEFIIESSTVKKFHRTIYCVCACIQGYLFATRAAACLLIAVTEYPSPSPPHPLLTIGWILIQCTSTSDSIGTCFLFKLQLEYVANTCTRRKLSSIPTSLVKENENSGTDLLKCRNQLDHFQPS